jgi:hypothetical protein
MPLDPQYFIAPSLEEYFVDKDTGLPLAAGVVRFYKDQARTEPKVIYTISGSPPNYSYVSLGSEITLSAVGTFQDDNGNNVLPYYKPYDDDGNVELYYITVDSEGGVRQFTREGYPNIIDSAANTTDGILNFIPNPQFLVHSDVPVTPLNDTGKIVESVTILGQGGWTYEIPPGSSTTDFVTFERYGAYVTNPTGNPRYAVKVNCQSPNGADAYKDLRVKFDDVNKFASDTDQYTFTFTAASLGTDLDIELVLIKNFGTAGSTSTTTSIKSFTLTPTEQIFHATFSFGDNAGKTIGPDDDDYLQLAIAFPTNASFTAELTDFGLFAGSLILDEFPATTDADMQARSIVPAIPAYDSSDLYLPLVLTPSGLIYSHADIGKVYPALYITPNAGELLCNGAQYETEAYSSDGIPYRRLQAVLNTSGIPKYGTGAAYLTAYIAAAGNLRIPTNAAGAVTNATAATSGFVVDIDHTGGTYGLKAFTYGSGVIVISDAIGTVTPPAAGTSGFTIVDVRNLTNTRHIFTIVATGSTGLEGKYFTFSTTTTNYYMWFKVNGVGVDPAPGGTGIMVNLPSGALVDEVERFIREALSGYQITSVYQNNAASITSGSYFTLETLTQGYYIWYRKDGAGIEPIVPGKKGIRVDIVTGDTNVQVGQKTANTINDKYFAVPDFRGLFLRGWDENGGWDIDQNSRFGVLSNLSGDQLGTFQIDSFLSHLHTASTSGGALYESVFVSGSNASLAAGPDDGYNFVNINTNLSVLVNLTGGDETRPVNANVNWVIKY